jgi:hypothetical protein
VHEFCLSVVKDVVVAEEGVAAKLVSYLIAALNEWLLIEVVADSYRAADDKVHFKHFVLFIVNHVLVLLFVKMARLEAIGDVVEEFAVFVLLGVKEKSEVVEHVVEKVVNDNTSLDTSR